LCSESFRLFYARGAAAEKARSLIVDSGPTVDGADDGVGVATVVNDGHLGRRAGRFQRILQSKLI